ncbi:MAG: UDP-N-acetyl-D-mannosamine dehydrogenase, partial [Verrucomicrobia bacterium]|nr:UDP-N-acetyl-D-mannosamine dehydrogenase [Verrucomicrobiota bacterium]
KAELVSLDEAVSRASIILVLVDHRSFGSLTLAQLAGKALVDTRGLVK